MAETADQGLAKPDLGSVRRQPARAPQPRASAFCYGAEGLFSPRSADVRPRAVTTREPTCPDCLGSGQRETRRFKTRSVNADAQLGQPGQPSQEGCGPQRHRPGCGMGTSPTSKHTVHLRFMIPAVGWEHLPCPNTLSMHSLSSRLRGENISHVQTHCPLAVYDPGCGMGTSPTSKHTAHSRFIILAVG